MKDEPLVSVIVPAYNMADYTRATVESLLAQTWRRIEIIVVDDGSTDRTGDVLRAFGGRIRAIRQENRGACAARNRGLRASSGEYVAFLDCDDLYDPEKLERVLCRFREEPRVQMIYTPEYLIDGEDRIIGINQPPVPRAGRIFRPLLESNFIGSSTPVIRREALQVVGGWDEAIFTTADWELWLRVARDFEVGYEPEPLSYSRQVSRYNQRNVEMTGREAGYVLEKLRRTGVPEARLRVARSRVDLLLHRYHFDNGAYAEARRHLLRSLRARPVQLEGYLLLLLSSVFRPLYRALRGWRSVRGVAGIGERIPLERSG